MGDITGSKKAAKAQVDSSELAAQAQLEALDKVLASQNLSFEEARGFLEPFLQNLEGGSVAFDRARNLVGGAGVEVQQQALDEFQTSPLTNFLQERGTQGINRNAAALGKLGGGNVLKELTEFSQNLALNDFQNQVNNLLGIANTELGLVQGLANLRTQQGAAEAQALLNQGNVQAQNFQNIGQANADRRLRDGQFLTSALKGSLGAFGGAFL